MELDDVVMAEPEDSEDSGSRSTSAEARVRFEGNLPVVNVASLAAKYASSLTISSTKASHRVVGSARSRPSTSSSAQSTPRVPSPSPGKSLANRSPLYLETLQRCLNSPSVRVKASLRSDMHIHGMATDGAANQSSSKHHRPGHYKPYSSLRSPRANKGSVQLDGWLKDLMGAWKVADREYKKFQDEEVKALIELAKYMNSPESPEYLECDILKEIAILDTKRAHQRLKRIEARLEQAGIGWARFMTDTDGPAPEIRFPNTFAQGHGLDGIFQATLPRPPEAT